MMTFNQLSVDEKIRFLADVKYVYIANNILSPQWGLCKAIKIVIELWYGDDFNISMNDWMGDWWFFLATNFCMRTNAFCRNCTNKRCQLCQIYEGFWWPVSDIAVRVAFINHSIKYIISKHFN